MAYRVQDQIDPAAFDRLLAFQENSAHEISHRRHHAEGIADPELMRFRDQVNRSRSQPGQGRGH